MATVERLSMIDGVAVALGHCHPRERPVLVYGDQELPNQVCYRHPRGDVAELYDEDGLRGFRCVSGCGHLADDSLIAVRFQDGTTLRRTLPNASDAHGLMSEFAGHVEANPGSSMIEIGSRARSGTVYKDRFPSLGRYAGIDIKEGPNVDIVADAHTLSQTVSDKFDYAFSVSVFEHLIMPWVAAFELNKVLRPGGLIYIQSHPAYPLHEEPWDFFRFSTNAWKGLFNKFTGFEVVKTGYSLEAAIVPLNASNGALQGIDRATTFLVSAVIARKIGDPLVDWAVDPAGVTDINYSYQART